MVGLLEFLPARYSISFFCLGFLHSSLRQLAEEENGLCLLHCGRLQGGEVVPHDGGPGVAAHRVIQPSTRYLGGAEAVGAG